MNEHDSENIAGMLEGMGYVLANDPYEAEVVVLNTCSVREHADKRFYGMLGQFKKGVMKKGYENCLRMRMYATATACPRRDKKELFMG